MTILLVWAIRASTAALIGYSCARAGVSFPAMLAILALVLVVLRLMLKDILQ